MIEVHRHPYNSDITGAQWERIEPLLPKQVEKEVIHARY